MLYYLVKKLSYAFITLLGVITVIFFLFTVLPGDPARMMLDQNEDPEQLAKVRAKYGFDKPVLTQYGYYLNDLSLLSFHSKDATNYTSLETGKYNATPLFSRDITQHHYTLYLCNNNSDCFRYFSWCCFCSNAGQLDR